MAQNTPKKASQKKIQITNSKVRPYLTLSHYSGGNSKYRGTWLRIPLRRERLDIDYGKAIYGKTQADVLNQATQIIDQARANLDSVGIAERHFDEHERNSIFTLAKQIKDSGLNVLEVMDKGHAILKRRKEGYETPLAHFWDGFIKAYDINDEKGKPLWSPNYKDSYLWFFKNEKDKFFQNTIGTFEDTNDAQEAVKELFKRNYNPRKFTSITPTGKTAQRTAKGWKGKGTCQAYLSRLKLFFNYVRTTKIGKAFITKAKITEFLDYDDVVGRGRVKNSATAAANLEQVSMLIHCHAENGHRKGRQGRRSKARAGYIVFKFFLGVRSELIQRYTWSCWNREKNTITIPTQWQKLKKKAIKINVDSIPNLKAWLNWSYKQDGEPPMWEKICPTSRTTTQKNRKKFMNDHKETFALEDEDTGKIDLRKTIEPAITHKNFERNTFITNGTALGLLPADQSLGFTIPLIQKIAEDKFNLSKYQDRDKMDNADDARAFFQMTPDNYKQYLPESYLNKLN